MSKQSSLAQEKSNIIRAGLLGLFQAAYLLFVFECGVEAEAKPEAVVDLPWALFL
jgi:hypothetical protein